LERFTCSLPNYGWHYNTVIATYNPALRAGNLHWLTAILGAGLMVIPRQLIKTVRVIKRK
jgi:hypothetical protein